MWKHFAWWANAVRRYRYFVTKVEIDYVSIIIASSIILATYPRYISFRGESYVK